MKYIRISHSDGECILPAGVFGINCIKNGDTIFGYNIFLISHNSVFYEIDKTQHDAIIEAFKYYEFLG